MTPLPDTPIAAAGRALAAAAARELAAGSTGPWIVAFSGGPDSLALAIALSRLDRPAIVLVHVDHGLDPESGARAARAEGLAEGLGLLIEILERNVAEERRRGENLEAAARRVRYAALESARSAAGADRILTAHHRDDQIETLLMRLVSGSGLFGLAGIRERRGALWRPALALTRSDLGEVVAASGLEPIQDPTNLDLERHRNRIRHELLPHLRRSEPDVEEALAGLGRRAAAAAEVLGARLGEIYHLRANERGAELDAAAMGRYPPLLNLLALQRLEMLAEATPSSGRARTEVLRQIASSREGAWPGAEKRRWRVRDGRLALVRETTETPSFSYNLRVPGEVAVPELGGRMRLRPAAVEGWMRRGERDRAAIRFPGPIPAACEVRNRRPGDRLRPLGAAGMRGLKELFIDRKVERSERDRVPLLVVGGRIAWVRGIAIDEAFRIGDEQQAWVAEWLSEDVPPDGGRT